MVTYLNLRENNGTNKRRWSREEVAEKSWHFLSLLRGWRFSTGRCWLLSCDHAGRGRCIHLVCLFLELSGLDQFVAASHGVQRKVTAAMEETVVGFGQEEQQWLAENMEPRQITVCEDETFHPAVCLVAIEPVSNFILLEQYADNRQAEAWTRSLAKAAADFFIEIVQSTGDEGRGLLHHVEVDLGAHHSPHVFHAQQKLPKGTSGALASKTRQAERTVAEAPEQISAHQEAQADYHEAEDAERPQEWAEQLAQAQEQEQMALQVLETAMAQQERARQAIQGISVAYHP